MSRRVAIIVVVSVCSLVTGWWICHRLGYLPPLGPPEQVRTVGTRAQWHIDRCREHIRLLARKDGGVLIVHDGWFMPTPTPLRIGDVFRSRLDDHAATRYTILAVEPDGVRVEYESTFDHRSSGKNLVSIDSGRIVLPWTSTTEAASALVQRAASFRLLSSLGRPFLTDTDIVSYSWPTHSLILKSGVVARLRSEMRGKGQVFPFRAEANGVVCYEGVFTVSTSSLSQSCAVINLTPIDGTPDERENRLSIALGYPTEKFFRGEDPRGDPRIRAALTTLGKLKDSDTKSSRKP